MATPTVSRDTLNDNKFINASRTDAMGSNPDTWTSWFNVDNPHFGNNNGDYETVYKIQRTHTICSKDYIIAAAECRINGDPTSTFTVDTPRNQVKDRLERFCTTDGLVCNNEDQIFEEYCQDYSIRFRCHYNDNKDDSSYPQFDVRIYIILAVVPILIFLLRMLWTYVCRRRRQQRRNQRRSRNRLGRGNDDIDDDSSSAASGVANPPPSYQDLFGKTGHATSGSSVFAISRENIPICPACQMASCSVATIIGKQRSLQNSTASEQSEPGETDTGHAEGEGQPQSLQPPDTLHQQLPEEGSEHREEPNQPAHVTVNNANRLNEAGMQTKPSSTSTAISISIPAELSSESEGELVASSVGDEGPPPALRDESTTSSAFIDESSSISVLAEVPEAYSTIAETPGLPVSSVDTPDLLASSAETPDVTVSSMDTPDLPVSSMDTPDLPVSSMDTPDLPVSSTEIPDLPISSMDRSDLSASSVEIQGVPVASMETPGLPVSSIETPYLPVSSTRVSPSLIEEVYVLPEEAFSSPTVVIEVPDSTVASSSFSAPPEAHTSTLEEPTSPSYSSETPNSSLEEPTTSSDSSETIKSSLAEHNSSSDSSETTKRPTEQSYSPSTSTEILKSSPELSISAEAPTETPRSPIPIFSLPFVTRSTPNYETSPEVTIQFTQADSTNGSFPENTVLYVHSNNEEHQNSTVSTLSTLPSHLQTDNHLHQNSSLSSISETSAVSASSSTAPASVDAFLSLSPSLLNVADISDPCACPCHRTIPLKQKGEACYDNQGYAHDGDVEAGRHPSYPGMHIPAFGFHRVYSDLSFTSSVAQADLPTYELAIELIKETKNIEEEPQPRSD